MPTRKGFFGFPLYEVALCVVLAGSVIGLLAERIDTLLEQGEKIAVEMAIMNMRSGLRLEKARRIAAGQNMQNIVGRDPRSFLSSNSGGQESGKLLDSSTLVAKSGWFFEPRSSVLVYRPARHRHLKLLGPGVDERLVWQIQARSAKAMDVDIVPLTPYRWF